MAGWNGAGVFSRTYNWVQDQINGILIRADRHDANDTDFVNGINNCLTKDGQNSPTANLPMGSFKHTNVAKATALDQYATAEQIIDNELTYYTTSGTDTYTIAPSPAITAYAAGTGFRIKIGTTNTGASTLNVNALGAKTIKTPAGAALTAGALLSGSIVDVTYDGTDFIINGDISKVASITSGTINGATVGVTTPAAGNFTTIGATTRGSVAATTGNFNALITATAGINPNASGGVDFTNFDVNQYTPTLTNVTNVAASTAFSTNYVRWNNYCAVFGRVDIDPTATGAIELGMTLPIASNFSSSIQLGGGAWCTAINQHLAIVPDTTNDRLSFQGITTDASNRQYSFLTIYRIL